LSIVSKRLPSRSQSCSRPLLKSGILPQLNASQGYRQATITTWRSREGSHAQTLHERFFCHLHLPYLQLDELRTRLRCATQVLWLWLVIDPTTKLLPVL